MKLSFRNFWNIEKYLGRLFIMQHLFWGYASNCRISREDEEKMLEKDIAKLEEENKKYPPLEELETEWRTLRADCQHLKQLMGITDDDSEFSLSDIEPENEIKEDYDVGIKEENDDDQYTSSDEHDSDHWT